MHAIYDFKAFFPLRNYALCLLCKQRAQLFSEGRTKKDFTGAFLLCAFLVCREKKPAKVAGRKKGIYIYIFSPTLPLA
jgi:hypothetical protein